MAISNRNRAQPRTSPALRLVVLVGLVVAVRQLGFGPALSVQGAWEGGLADVRSLPRGFESNVAGGLTFNDKGASVTVEDGHMNLRWADGPVSLSMDDGKAWQANITEKDMEFRSRGSGLNDFSWEATKRSAVDGLGDVEIDLNSARDFGVSVEPHLPDIAGAKVKVLTHSRGDDIYGRLEAQRALSKNVDLKYTVENVEGDYDPANLAHAARLVGRLGDGTMVLNLANQGQTPSYNATYAHNLGGDSGLVLGVDDDGVYGTFAKDLAISKGLAAAYQFAGRSHQGDWSDPTFAQSAKLSHDLGTLKLSHANGEPVHAVLESEIGRGSNSVQGKLGYTLGSEEPTFNLTFSSDLAGALKRLEGDGTMQVGIDSASPDGLYGKLAAGRKLRGGYNVHYASEGRLNDMEHSLMLSNDLGYGQVVKKGDDDPRLRLGYQFNA